MTLYIDYFCCLPKSSLQEFNGGSNSANMLIKEISRKNPSINIVLFCPHWYENKVKSNFWSAYNNVRLYFLEEESIYDYDYGEKSIYFIPVLYRKDDFKKIKKLKEIKQSLKICAIIHDLRMLDYVPDITEKYFFTGVNRTIFPMFHFFKERIIARTIEKKVIREGIACLDQIYTVSNYAMQDIISVYNRAKVNWYYLNSALTATDDGELKEFLQGKEFTLFVSGGRRLKNFNHALAGFIKYKEKNPENEMFLVVTGIDERRFNSLCCIPGLKQEIINKYVIRYDYVETGELKALYKNCRYLLYTSKMEGFGLPVLEVAAYGKTCIASNRTSIPEVVGAAVRYVCPTDDEGIAEAMELLGNNEELKKYEDRVKVAMDIVMKRIKMEQSFMIDDLLSL